MTTKYYLNPNDIVYLNVNAGDRKIRGTIIEIRKRRFPILVEWQDGSVMEHLEGELRKE